jgi:hypothetical protein
LVERARIVVDEQGRGMHELVDESHARGMIVRHEAPHEHQPG